MTSPGGLREQLFHEILMARQRVYAVAGPTPLEPLNLDASASVVLKREDLSPIHAYKWRGAFNRMAVLTPEERDRGVVAASAGNHAQGVALAARKLGVRARIFMPVSTPRMKQVATKQHGGDHVEIVLVGDTYDEAAAEAIQIARDHRQTFIHPYDDLITMGGQGTLADEVVMAGGPPLDVAYIQIGGGGLASAVSCWLKSYYPRIRIVGVEGVDQASMRAAFDAGKPVALDYLDVFSDGTAVRKVGDLTYPLCHELLDDLITVTNDELCAAIQLVWERSRCVPEPAGAMGLAGLMKQINDVRGARVLTILCGANMDFGQLGWIARHAGIGAARRRFYRFEINEQQGSMLDLLESGLEGLNIIEFQYGKTDPSKAWPVIGFEASPPELELLGRRLEQLQIPHEDVTSQEDVEFRIIHYEATLFQNPWFIHLEFPERAGALHDFLTRIRGIANVCYFNYAYSGERVGHALMGFEFETPDGRDVFIRVLQASGWTYHQLAGPAQDRILS